MGFTPQQISTAQAIANVYARYGLNPAGGIAVGLGESNLNPSAIGDNNTSFGTFQLHQGGALGSHTQAWANDPTNAATMAAQALVAAGGKGLSGDALQRLQTKVFEKPLNPANDNNPAHYASALAIMKQLGLAPPASAGTLASTTAAAQNAVDPAQAAKAAGASYLAGFAPSNAADQANPGGYAGAALLNNFDLMTSASLKAAQPPISPGTGGPGTAPPAPAAPTKNGLVSPFAAGTKPAFGGVDYGVDFTYGNSKVPTQAMASGTVAQVGSGWGHVAGPYQSGAAVWVKLDKPINGQQYMYYAEGIPNVKQGQRVTAGQNIMYDTGEMGLAPNPNVNTLVHTPQPSGNAMNAILKQFGLG